MLCSSMHLLILPPKLYWFYLMPFNFATETLWVAFKEVPFFIGYMVWLWFLEQILGTGMDTHDTMPSILLFIDNIRIIFNAGEVKIKLGSDIIVCEEHHSNFISSCCLIVVSVMIIITHAWSHCRDYSDSVRSIR